MNNFSERRSGIFVLPGIRLGVIEEFIPQDGTYVRDGVIYSKMIGHALLDLSNKRVSVYPLIKEANTPQIGSIVVGFVSNVQNENAIIKIFKIGNKVLSGFFPGMLHVSDVQQRYVNSIFDVCRRNDIIRAKVISNTNQIYHLSTKEKNLGVILAHCSQCGYTLKLRQRKPYCSICRRSEKRRTALDYGKYLA